MDAASAQWQRHCQQSRSRQPHEPVLKQRRCPPTREAGWKVSQKTPAWLASSARRATHQDHGRQSAPSQCPTSAMSWSEFHDRHQTAHDSQQPCHQPATDTPLPQKRRPCPFPSPCRPQHLQEGRGVTQTSQQLGCHNANRQNCRSHREMPQLPARPSHRHNPRT